MILTIGVPTYNRLECVKKILYQIADSGVLEYAKCIVIDDGSTDFTFSTVSVDPKLANLTVLKNDHNKGYPSTLIRLIEECTTQYLMIVADDDIINPYGVKKINHYLENNKPAFLSPVFMRGDTVYRGKRETREILLREYRSCSAHASGLVYDVGKFKKTLPVLRERLHARKEDSVIYPQVVMLIQLLLKKEKCYWIRETAVHEGARMRSGIVGFNGLHFSTEASRQAQASGFRELLKILSCTPGYDIKKAKAIMKLIPNPKTVTEKQKKPQNKPVVKRSR